MWRGSVGSPAVTTPFLCVCRLVPYKRVDLVVEAFNRLGLPLLVVGDGPERSRLEALAGGNVTLLGVSPSSRWKR
jgi:glycosyltransferase involved in cell wall biosynthesis